MLEDTEHQQPEIQEAHRERSVGGEGEPMYGLAELAGHAGEAPVEESAEDELEAEPGQLLVDSATNLTWGIVLGGALLLFLTAAILLWGVGSTYGATIISNYPVK